MANVVVTGSTKGLGKGLADAFARLGHNVVITSRRQADIATVTQEINKKSEGQIIGQVCDISDKKQVEDYKTVSEEISEVMSHLQGGNGQQKTEKQKSAENKGL